MFKGTLFTHSLLPTAKEEREILELKGIDKVNH
jgi:hypothetical protein